MSERTSFAASGHSIVSPYVMCAEAARVIDFLATVFGASTLVRHLRDDGSIQHASVKIGDSVVMISDATQDYPAFPAWMHVYVADVDETYRRALDAGATSLQEPSEKGDGDRRGGVSDPSGNAWWIATHIDR